MRSLHLGLLGAMSLIGAAGPEPIAPGPVGPRGPANRGTGAGADRAYERRQREREFRAKLYANTPAPGPDSRQVRRRSWWAA